MESKWVSEHILDEAARRTPLKPTVARLTQAVGGPNGYWSEKEWFAKMIKSSIFLGKMLVIPGVSYVIISRDPSWLVTAA